MFLYRVGGGAASCSDGELRLHFAAQIERGKTLQEWLRHKLHYINLSHRIKGTNGMMLIIISC